MDTALISYMSPKCTVFVFYLFVLGPFSVEPKAFSRLSSLGIILGGAWDGEIKFRYAVLLFQPQYTAFGRWVLGGN